MSEDPRERTLAYLALVEKSLKLAETITNPEVLRVIDYAKRYASDSKYYLENGKPITALASIAYAEGLLDSLYVSGMTRKKDAPQKS
jgi:hypothetical protein